MKKLVLFFVVVLVGGAHAARYAGEFLEIGVGARAVGMGGAVTAYADDALGFYWNPAAIGYVSGVQVSGMYADLWDGLANYSVVGLALPASGAVLGINYVRLGVPNIPEYPDYAASRNRVLNGDTLTIQEYLLATGAQPRGVFGDNESAVFLTFAKVNRMTLDFGWSYFQLPIELPIGASVKFINTSMHGSTGTGIGADFGAQIRIRTSDVFWEKWKGTICWGFNIQDATRTAIDWSQNNKDAIPTNYRAGAAYIQKLPGKQSQVAFSYDRESRWQRTDHYGLEYQYGGVLSLRGGKWGNEWTAGAGVSVWRATVDYAYLSRELGNTHRVSVNFKLR